MAGDEGVEQCWVAESGPSGGSAAQSIPRSVFLSYASRHAAVAKSIVHNLEQHGLRCSQQVLGHWFRYSAD